MAAMIDKELRQEGIEVVELLKEVIVKKKWNIPKQKKFYKKLKSVLENTGIKHNLPDYFFDASKINGVKCEDCYVEALEHIEKIFSNGKATRMMIESGIDSHLKKTGSLSEKLEQMERIERKYEDFFKALLTLDKSDSLMTVVELMHVYKV